ncbi:hypothetical protein CC1G_14138 [Coprinopsis cinerea okayama7|uniref:GLTSCR protein conserved domain-containing protein n=1 Tax=Coprinopsis cinerea (strain Okayama-7 / 130 / ATCC MYA-4618 / FGSC 9003) TaxID=240176 RepID=D6RLC3_COPC7|nr:hypothetical protein CC1G_14138 [Coprinopsis cinerea okayama7\|eukprot:XP_002911605.1 hypothetical protein CC1G_14138 [Coprinopsis cinerea okayama7\
MSTGVASSLNTESTQKVPNWTASVVKNGATSNGYTVAPSPVASTSSGSLVWQPPIQPAVQQPAQNETSYPSSAWKPHKAEKRTAEELEITAATAARVATRIAEDQAAVLNPDVDTPFEDEHDVVKRLLPYHIYQQPKDDLQAILDSKGKGKSVDRGLEAEIEETKFAIECYKRLERLKARWRRVKIREGQRASPDDQAYVLAQLVLEAERTETAVLSNELKTARNELDRIQKEQRLAANTARMTQFPAAPASTPTTTTPAPISAPYYRSYSYAYAQPYGNPAAHATTSTFPATPTTAPSPTTYTPYQPGGAIPVQLPVSSLPALHALGIIPVPATALPPEGQPQPPAILRGSSANGSMLSLEINVSLLQSAQMSGLAIILNSLVARNTSLAASAPGAYAAHGTTMTAPNPTTNGSS